MERRGRTENMGFPFFAGRGGRGGDGRKKSRETEQRGN